MDVRFDSSIRRRALGSLLVGAVALLNQSALGQSAESHPSIHADQLQLPNGSILVTEVDRAATGVAICAVFRTGTRDDPADHPGLADAVARGAAPEGTSVQVSADFTRFCAEVPSVDLARELSRWRAAFNPESALGSARPEPVPDAGAPFFGAPAKLFELALEGHAYEHARTGLVGGRLDADSARDFRAARYQPDALAFGIVGNFDSSRVTDLVAAAFGAESHRTLGRASVSALARQTSERFAALHVAAAQRDAAVQGWVIPASETPPHRALEVAAAVLSDSSKGMEASVAGLVDPDVFEIRVTAPRGANPDAALAAVDAALNRLKSIGPSIDEVERARARIESKLVALIGSGGARAGWLAEQALRIPMPLPADPLDVELQALAAVGPGDVRSAVAEFLTPARRTIVEVAAESERSAVVARGHAAVEVQRVAPPLHRSGVQRRTIRRNRLPRRPNGSGATRLDSPR